MSLPIFLILGSVNLLIANSTDRSPDHSLSLSVTIDGQDLPCAEGSFGAAAAVVDGGLPPYEFLWSSGQTSQIISFLTEGTYSVTVTDDAGATASASIEISTPDPIVLDDFTVIDATCDQEDGAIYVDISGGTPPYEFSWANGSEEEDLINIPDGDYTLVVIDANDCFEKFGPFDVDDDCDPPGPCDDGPELISAEVNETDCQMENGSIFLTISNVALPHTFEWSNDADTEDITGLGVGTYTLTLTDAEGCTQVLGPYTIEDDCDQIPCFFKPEITAFTVTDADCGQENGAIDITVDGGDPPFTFSWNYNGLVTEDIDNLPPGNYGVVIVDTEGCEDKFTFVVGEVCDPDPPCVSPQISSVVVVESTCGNSTGTAVINLVDGPQGYTFKWSPDVSDTHEAANLEAATYSVTISDGQNPDCDLVEVFYSRKCRWAATRCFIDHTSILQTGQRNGSHE